MRTAKRFPLKLPLAVKAGAQDHKTETSNISSAGVLFEVETEVAVGTVIDFSLMLPASVLGTPSDVRVNCTGRVTRCSKEGDGHTVAAVIDEYHFEHP